MEGRIACWIAYDYAHLRIMIDAPLQTRITRIAERSKTTFDEAKRETSRREREEKEWFIGNRGIDIDDKTVFDLVINTERLNATQVVNIIELAALSQIEWYGGNDDNE